MQISISNAIGGGGGAQGGGTPTPPPFTNLYSFDFDGVDDTFILPSAPSAYAFTGDFTLMAWVKVDTIENNYYIIDTSKLPLMYILFCVEV